VVVLLGILIGLISFKLKPDAPRIKAELIIAISILLLLLTFISDGAINVHRWIGIGFLKFNIGTIVSPILLIQIYRLQHIKLSIFIAAFVTILFLIQPDASQVTAFSVAATLLLINKIEHKVHRIYILLTIFLCLAMTWYNLDKLPAINYVENIVQMAGDISTPLMILSILALFLLPFPFFAVYSKKDKLIALSLGMYYTLTILSTFIGNFPVMFMGYGISPILGYFVGLIWLLNKEGTK
jgi:uncharacterized membrane protein YhaH (DUF805 family)